MWGRNDSNHPFSNYEFGQIVKNEKNEFLMRNFTDVLFKVTGYGTSNPIFTKDVYSNPDDPLPWTIIGGGDRSIYSLPMDEKEILDFTLTLSKHFITLSNKSLKDRCYSSIAKNLSFFNLQILPIEIKEGLENTYTTNRKTI